MEAVMMMMKVKTKTKEKKAELAVKRSAKGPRGHADLLRVPNKPV